MLDLAAWHAEPLAQDEVEARLARLGTATAWAERLEALRLRLMLGLPTTMQREVLMAEADDDLQRAAVRPAKDAPVVDQSAADACAYDNA